MRKARWEKYNKEELKNFLLNSSSLNDFAKKVGYDHFSVNIRTSILKDYPDLKELFDCINKQKIKINNKLVGYHFNNITVISYARRKDGHNYWNCRCDCGNDLILRQYQIEHNITRTCMECARKNRKIQSSSLLNQKKGTYTVVSIDPNNEEMLYCKCDCGNPELIPILRTSFLRQEHNGCKRCVGVPNLKGKTFGRLTVNNRHWENYDGKNARWDCQCSCGTKTIVSTAALVNYKTLSCGCINSKGEFLLKTLFNKMKIPYISQYTFPDLKDNGLLRFDFAIFKQDKLFCLIEYQGIQHYQSIEYWGGDEYLKDLQKKDNMKIEYCIKNNIPLYHISQSDFNKINEDFIKNLLEGYYE